MFQSGQRAALRLHSLLRRPRDLLMTILIGNMLVNITLSSLAADLFGEARIIAVGSITLALLVFGEITPKNIAYAYNRKISLLASLPLAALLRFFAPFRKFLYWITNPVIRRFHGPEGDDALVTRDEILTAVVSGHRQGVLEKDERDLIANVLEFSMKDARHIMTPRTQIKALPAHAPLEEAIAFARKTGVSKIPVFKKDKDHIVGYLRTKDLLPYIRGVKKASGIGHLVYPVFYIPEGRGLGEFFPEMQRSTSRMAVVLDEYGGTAGIITLDDILEEVLGQFLDEDEKQRQCYRASGEGGWDFQGTVSLGDFNRVTGLDLYSDDYETLSGYLLYLAGRIPAPGDSFSDGTCSYTILKMEENRIIGIRVRRL
jgi:CBS domain containing-hemolysin-like protein